jgi:hypothetical protein
MHLFKWFIVSLTFINKHSKDMCYIEIGLRAQNKNVILDQVLEIMGRDNVITSPLKDHKGHTLCRSQRMICEFKLTIKPL